MKRLFMIHRSIMLLIVTVISSLSLFEAKAMRGHYHHWGRGYPRGERGERPIFRIRNNSNLPIDIRLLQADENGKLSGSDYVTVAPQEFKSVAGLDKSKEIKLKLRYCKAADNCPSEKKPFKLLATFPVGKNAFVAWDGQTITPRTGRGGMHRGYGRRGGMYRGGRGGGGGHGYGLRNNVAQEDIKVEYIEGTQAAAVEEPPVVEAIAVVEQPEPEAEAMEEPQEEASQQPTQEGQPAAGGMESTIETNQ